MKRKGKTWNLDTPWDFVNSYPGNITCDGFEQEIIKYRQWEKSDHGKEPVETIIHVLPIYVMFVASIASKAWF